MPRQWAEALPERRGRRLQLPRQRVRNDAATSHLHSTCDLVHCPHQKASQCTQPAMVGGRGGRSRLPTLSPWGTGDNQPSDPSQRTQPGGLLTQSPRQQPPPGARPPEAPAQPDERQPQAGTIQHDKRVLVWPAIPPTWELECDARVGPCPLQCFLTDSAGSQIQCLGLGAWAERTAPAPGAEIVSTTQIRITGNCLGKRTQNYRKAALQPGVSLCFLCVRASATNACEYGDSGAPGKESTRRRSEDWCHGIVVQTRSTAPCSGHTDTICDAEPEHWEWASKWLEAIARVCPSLRFRFSLLYRSSRGSFCKSSIVLIVRFSLDGPPMEVTSPSATGSPRVTREPQASSSFTSLPTADSGAPGNESSLSIVQNTRSLSTLAFV